MQRKKNREDPLPTGEDELFSSSLHKTLSKLDRKISAKVPSKVKIIIIIVPHFSLKNTILNSIYSFHRLCCGGLLGDISRDR